MNMSKRIKEPIFYPLPDSYYSCELYAANPYVNLTTEGGINISTQLIGAYNFDNIATALCLGKFFGVPSEKANDSIANYRPTNNRSQIIEKHGNSIILDAYNANPSSMEKALENLAIIHSENKVAIVGDMFELGDDAEMEHMQVGKKIKELNIQNAIFCGENMRHAYEAFDGGNYMENKDLLIAHLKEHKFKNATILIKASRGMALEDVVAYL